MADKSANKPKKGAHLIKKQAPKPEKPAQAVRTEAKQPKKKRRVPIGVKIAVGVVIAAAAGAFGYVYCYPNDFLGVTVGPITVGGMKRGDAANNIEGQSAPLYEGTTVPVTIFGSKFYITQETVMKNMYVILYDKNLIHHAVLLKQLSRLFPKTDPPADEKLFRLPIAYLKDIVVQSLLDYIALSHSHPRFLYSLVLQFINV